MAPRHRKSSRLSEQASPRGTSYRGKTILFTRDKFPPGTSTCNKAKHSKGCVGTLNDGCVRNVPLPRVPQIQSASPIMSHEAIAPKAGIPIPGYLHVPSWIPTLPKLGSILGFSQRLLWPFSPIAIKAKNNLSFRAINKQLFTLVRVVGVSERS